METHSYHYPTTTEITTINHNLPLYDESDDLEKLYDL